MRPLLAATWVTDLQSNDSDAVSNHWCWCLQVLHPSPPFAVAQFLVSLSLSLSLWVQAWLNAAFNNYGKADFAFGVATFNTGRSPGSLAPLQGSCLGWWSCQEGLPRCNTF